MKRFKLASLVALAFAALLPTVSFAGDRDDDDGDRHRADPALVKARQHFFGFENVDPQSGRVRKDKVIMSWFSVTSFAVAIRGRVFLLDAYIYRRGDAPAPGAKPNYVPTTRQELIDLKPEAIFLGHGHGDHADLAANIAVHTGATIVGTAEHCEAMAGDAVRQFGAGTTVKCTSAITAGSTPGAEVVDLPHLRPDVCITAFKHLHSGAVPVDPDFPQNLVGAVRDTDRANFLFPLRPSTDGIRTIALSGGAVSVAYQMTVAGSDFTFLWHNTGGPLKENAPQILTLLKGLPKTDIELASVVSLGESVNGVRDAVMYINAIQPKVFYALHTDNFNIGASNYYLQAIDRQYSIFNTPVAERPEIRGLHDPYDYLRPGLLTFDPKDDAWKDKRSDRPRAHCH